MPFAKLKQFLDDNHVKFDVIPHPTAYTAQGTAATAHVRGEELAKTVIIKIDEAFAMAVLPAPGRVDVTALRTALGAQAVRLASELEFKDLFPDCDTGAMPPFGNLYGMRVLVDEALAAHPQIAFNAGSHTELVRMAYADFFRLVQPTVLKFSFAKARAAAASDDRLW